MTNLDRLLKSRDITLQTKVYIVKAMFFPSSQVWMWELDHKEGWAKKNLIVVLEKTLETPLDSKEIKPINPKENHPWIFIGRTDAEAPILWSPDANSWLIGKVWTHICVSCIVISDSLWPMDWGLPGSSVHRILQVRILGGSPFHSPGDITDPGIKHGSLAL